MTTPTTDQRVVVVDDVGVLAIISSEYAATAVQQGQCVRTDRAAVVQLVPRPIRKLTPAEQRALFVKRQGAKR